MSTTPLAEELIGVDTARRLVTAIARAAPGYYLVTLRAAPAVLGGLALRERADLLRDALITDLPGSYDDFSAVVRAAAGNERFDGWLIWPVTAAVAQKAVAENTGAAFDDAMAVMAQLTPRLSAEFAIRTLLRHDLDRALPIVQEWTASPDHEVRRLATEGTRPYLPWSIRVPQILARPGVTMPILNALYRDDSEYVRRSVANHLNDLSRDQPDLVVDTARRWLTAPGTHTGQLVRHALRTLIKRGHPGALELLGFTPAAVEIDGPALDRAAIPFGGTLGFTATIHNPGPETARLAIDYVVHHRRANGSQSAKTFKLTIRTLAAGESVTISREHSFRAISTRRYYPGEHAIALQVNGVATEPVGFNIRTPDHVAEV
ncbi:3-methyladenine DNA glycosylase AlkC [Actinoplanes lutulentus]|uniref:3-methyladenine DNA glycosylase AlkC n=1 Tax=Actinoplanes lutulentus TaxID=1287878 RepID=A0A327YWB7_9ACTN|nr:DNA alkylation repair protein [Actinoplanes lutulentus]MBB2946477.1 3-methyladenine DNA glycosylase AlkC [Actinoplanes lutulentus]RAK24759.1 3-methyladenine DNA glycosylase AlkC [Actinoplanes lutulentus]